MKCIFCGGEMSVEEKARDAGGFEQHDLLICSDCGAECIRYEADREPQWRNADGATIDPFRVI